MEGQLIDCHNHLLQKGDLIEVLSMNASGLWRGRAHGRVGHFKFINVELMSEASLRPRPCRHRPQTLEQMLRTIHMEVGSTICLCKHKDLKKLRKLV